MIEFFVEGHPKPGGSKRAFVIPGTNRARVIDDNPKSRVWKAVVADFARRAFAGPPLTVPLAVDVTFHLLRPRCHYGTGKNADIVKASAPTVPAVKPDATKLWRSTEDALTGLLWRDDAQIVEQRICKIYSDRQGVLIRVELFA